MAPAQVSVSATSARTGDVVRIHARLHNGGASAALETKLTLLNAGDSSRILPAYYSDNYVSLLPGEDRTVDIEYPAAAAKGAAQLSLRGWNIPSSTIPVTAAP
jgi:hypothetical protein